MTPNAIYGVALVLLGIWASYTTSRTLVSPGGWREHRALVLLGTIFVVACLLPGWALLAGRFRNWMLVPLGLSYLALLPFPCYLKWANRGRMRTARTVLFVVIGIALLVLGLR